VDRVSTLESILEEARKLGLLGPETVDRHIRHARMLATRVDPPGTFLDLGSGAGVPGLILAIVWPAASGSLLDASARRSAFCERAISSLDLGDRVVAVRGRAEAAGRDIELRERFDLVVARSFARPAVAAECAAPFVRPGGRLLVSEPPQTTEGEARWPDEPLGELGLGPALRTEGAEVSSVVMEKVRPTPDRFPRRTGIPTKRPLWS
jgi:16S rRNA (guanine527-N7)-methyltransferase